MSTNPLPLCVNCNGKPAEQYNRNFSGKGFSNNRRQRFSFSLAYSQAIETENLLWSSSINGNVATGNPFASMLFCGATKPTIKHYMTTRKCFSVVMTLKRLYLNLHF